MNGLRSWFEIFGTGTHTDMSGKTISYTEKDLDQMVASFNEGALRVPLVIGHSGADTAPAYGWVAKLRRKGDKLEAKAKDINVDFEEVVRKKMYRNVSIQHDLSPQKNLRHVAFLGAKPPAVKGLADVSFAAPDGVEVVNVSYSEEGQSLARQVSWRLESAYEILRAVKNHLIETEGQEKADDIIPEWTLENIKRPVEVEDEKNYPSFGEKEDKMDKTEREISLEKENEALKAQNAAYAEKETAARKKEIASFAEGMVKKGVLKPADKDGFVSFVESVDSGQTVVSFAEGEKKSPADYFMQFMESLPTAGNPHDGTASYGQGESQTEATLNDEGREALDKKVREYAKEHKVSYSEAVNEVISVMD